MPIQLVQLNGANGHLQSTNTMFPPSFPSFLLSAWCCCPTGFVVGESTVNFVQQSFFSFSVPHTLASGYIQLRSGFLDIYDATFPLAPNQLWHCLASVNTTTQVVQVYINDQPVPLSGGWKVSGRLLGPSTVAQVFYGYGGPPDPPPACAEVWEAATPTFVDLSQVANRRKFINADLSAVDLGANGSAPFGYSPEVYLTAVSSPTDLLINRGSGGGTLTLNPSSNTVSWQAPGICTLPPPPTLPPEPARAGPPYLREMTYRHRTLGRHFDPTVVLIKDRPGPLRIVEFIGVMK